jgi:hypothetical protein
MGRRFSQLRPGGLGPTEFSAVWAYTPQFRHLVATAHQISSKWDRKSPGRAQENFACSVAPHSSKRALQVSRDAAGHRPGCDPGGAKLVLTEFSELWAYTPKETHSPFQMAIWLVGIFGGLGLHRNGQLRGGP